MNLNKLNLYNKIPLTKVAFMFSYTELGLSVIICDLENLRSFLVSSIPNNDQSLRNDRKDTCTKVLSTSNSFLSLLHVLQHLLEVKSPTDGAHASFIQGEFFECLKTGGVKHV